MIKFRHALVLMWFALIGSMITGCSSSSNNDNDDDGNEPVAQPASISIPNTTVTFEDENAASRTVFFTVTMDDNTTKTVVAESIVFDDPSIAAYESSRITPLKEGQTVATATFSTLTIELLIVVGGDTPPPPPTDDPELSVTSPSSSVLNTETVCLSATYKDENGATSDVSNNIIITLSPSTAGTVAANCITATVNATQNVQATAAYASLSQSLNFNFIFPVDPTDDTVTQLEITSADYTLTADTQLTAKAMNASNEQIFDADIQWKSLNPDRLTVDSDGNASIIDAKWAYAFVEATSNGVTATAKYTLAASDDACDGNIDSVTIHYQREDNDYAGWGLHVWGAGWESSQHTVWPATQALSQPSDFGASVTLDVVDSSAPMNFIVHKNGSKDPDPDLAVPCGYSNVYVLAGDGTVYTTAPTSNRPAHRKAIWTNEDTIRWPSAGSNVRLFYSAEGDLAYNGSQISGGESISLSGSGGTYKISGADVSKVKSILKTQMWLINGAGSITGVQHPGVLDDLYTYNGDLGPIYNNGTPTLKVWAPTAQSVRVRIFDDEASTQSTIVDLTEDSNTGVWSVTGSADWDQKYYLFEVTVYHHLSDQIETMLVTDPYSVTLSMNSQRSQFIDLDSPATKPQGWDNIVKLPLDAPEDASIYELHVRDFSQYAASNDLPDNLRGKFLAFTQANYSGMQHLKSLADAGLTHLHLMPAFDIATVNEDIATRDDDKLVNLESYGAASEEQQELIGLYRDNDGFNWGYDPLHYGAPEGSYATDPNGVARVIEFRQMVSALNDAGLKVVMDVVYNHTSSSGLWFFSVLDRIVPGYYHRYNADGSLQTSSCCDDTASENDMMEKLMADTLVRWAKHYKVDSFRFDLMGHHLKSHITVTVRNALNELTVANDGVDGPGIYLYGEGWDFGGLQNEENMDQFNSGGTGVGTYNDRIRDAITGGPFEDRLSDAGVLHGGFAGDSVDRVRIGLAGNLRNYWNGDSEVGYTQDPQENIVYVSKHDNYTLWDMGVPKASGLNINERVEMQKLGMAYVVLAQGIPFLHAGVELLRSKSGDRNSYNSGDWFNRLDFTGQSHNWGSGMPPAWGHDNGEVRTTVWPGLLTQDKFKPSADHIADASNFLRELLAVRKDVKLLRLETRQQIENQLRFENTGNASAPGAIVVRVTDSGNMDDKYNEVITVFNAGSSTFSSNIGNASSGSFSLHPAMTSLAGKATANGKTVTVPARSAAVFVAQ